MYPYGSNPSHSQASRTNQPTTNPTNQPNASMYNYPSFAQATPQFASHTWEQQSQENFSADRLSQRISFASNAQTPVPKKVEKSKPDATASPTLSSKKCGLKNCVFCKDGTIPYLQNIYKPGWRESAIAAFKGILASDTSKGWLSLTDDIYPLFETHWDVLCPSRKEKDDAWRKHLQDALSHNKKYFVSGKEVFGQTGYWRLRQLNEDESAAQKRTKRAAEEEENNSSPDESHAAKKQTVQSVKTNSPSIPRVDNFPYNSEIAQKIYEHQISQQQAYSIPPKTTTPISEESDSPPLVSPDLLAKEFGIHFSKYLSRTNILKMPTSPSSQGPSLTPLSGTKH